MHGNIIQQKSIIINDTYDIWNVRNYEITTFYSRNKTKFYHIIDDNHLQSMNIMLYLTK